MLPLVQRLGGAQRLSSLCHHHLHCRFLALSLTQSDQTGSSGDTFGRLAQENKQKYSRYKKSLAADEEPTWHSRDVATPRQGALKPHRDEPKFSQDKVLEQWHQFKSAQDQEHTEAFSWGSGQEDDAEEDYHLFVSQRSPGSQGQEITPKKIAKMKKLHQKATNSASDTFGGAGPPQEAPEGETFGHLSPKSDIPESDEGDRREEQYEEAKHARKHRPQFYGMRMKELCRERKLAEAIKILEEEMPAVGAKPNDFCYQVLINACGRAGYTKKAFQLYNQMKKRGLKVQPVAYTGLFLACAHSPWPTTDGLQRATQLRMQLKEKGYHFNQTISHVMIKAFGWCGDIGTAFLVVDEMIENEVLVTTETINFLLQACITDKEAGFRHAVKVWRKMRELKLQPDIYSYNLLTCIIKECGAGDPSLTSSLLTDEHDSHKPRIKSSKRRKQLPEPATLDVKAVQIEPQGLPVDEPEETAAPKKEEGGAVQRLEDRGGKVVLPNILGHKMTAGDVVALGALDKPQDRLALLGGPPGILRQMVRDKVTPDLKTFTQLLDAMPPDTQAEQALVESMKNLGLEPDTQFFNMLIKRRNFRHDSKAAQEVIELMQEHHIIPDLITYGCLALGCRSVHSARQLLKDMDASQFRPNIEIMASLVRNSLVRKDYAFTMAMMNEMQRRGTTPNDRLLNLLEKARAEARSSLLERGPGAKNQDRRIGSAKAFLAAYKTWLMSSPVQLPEHPWAQYR